MELGLASFADVAPGADPARVAQRLSDLLEEIALADQLGLEVFGVGEHHRPDYAVSSPPVVLAAAAARTERIRLSSAVTVLSSADPVKVFQDFATVDLLSGGRAEVMAGRGSFIESFPLFGLDLEDYDDLFAEKLSLLLALRASERVTWSGRHRAALQDAGVFPRPLQQPLPVWIAVGGSPGSIVRAGALGLPLMLAIIGGAPARFAPLIDLYREAVRKGADQRDGDTRRKDAPTEGAGDTPDRLTLTATATARPAASHSEVAVGINSHTYVATTSQQAANEFFPAYAPMMNRIGRERGWAPLTREQFDRACGPDGHLLVGSPRQVTEKILAEHELFGHDRFLAHISVGTLPHEHAMRATELFATEVAPAVREALGHAGGSAAPPAGALDAPGADASASAGTS
jgi:alkanesulfonate monooxygenase SsuD/methylene tetrahydromethanopterin reductase-like flavin-dependent oxidoreductase (luciferase family)